MLDARKKQLSAPGAVVDMNSLEPTVPETTWCGSLSIFRQYGLDDDPPIDLLVSKIEQTHRIRIHADAKGMQLTWVPEEEVKVAKLSPLCVLSLWFLTTGSRLRTLYWTNEQERRRHRTSNNSRD